MLNDQAALRRYDDSYSKDKTEVGSKGILFHSQMVRLKLNLLSMLKKAMLISSMLKAGSVLVQPT
jgi:hypothetical protein